MHEVRFAADWLAIWPEKTPVGLAVSGGPDSLALLLMAHATMPGEFKAVTVDHGLRPESLEEAHYVASLCVDLGVPHEILTLSLASGSALQERARAARYGALGEWAARNGLAAIATAHHADDQAETLMMRLSRGAGVRGLAAMREIASVPGRPDCRLLRPLLGWRRRDLAQIVADARIEPLLDPSNQDHRFERVRIRTLLSGMEEIDPLSIAASARHLAEADAAIDWAAEQCLAAVRVSGGVSCWDHRGVPRVVALRVLERILVDIGGVHPRGNALARWYDRLATGEIATLAGVRGDGRKPEWRFAAAPRPRSSPDKRAGRP